MADPAPVTRAEFDELVGRVRQLEEAIAIPELCPSRSDHQPLGYFCALHAEHPLPHVATDTRGRVLAQWPAQEFVVEGVFAPHGEEG